MNDMADAAGEGSHPVFRLIYRSHSLITPEESKTALGEIFTTARRNNKRAGVTGALVISGDSFVQALEGDEPVVRELYATITEDPRHDELSILAETVVEERTFGRWAMARVSSDGGPDLRLMSNASKQVIVAARGDTRGVTEEEQTVLAFMRESLVPEGQGRAASSERVA